MSAVRFAWQSGQAPLFRLRPLSLGPGQTLFVQGPSGCGKSTLLSLLCGVLLPTEGGVSVMGRDWRSLRPAQRDAWRADHIGYIFQQFNLLPYLSPIDNVLLPCRWSARRRQGAAPEGGPRAQAQALLRTLQLPPDAWQRPCHQLSVGQQQRVAAARALVGRPSLLLADEPTSALDEATREAFMHTLLAACQQAACAVVFVSHDARLARHFEQVRHWADWVEPTDPTDQRGGGAA